MVCVGNYDNNNNTGNNGTVDNSTGNNNTIHGTNTRIVSELYNSDIFNIYKNFSISWTDTNNNISHNSIEISNVDEKLDKNFSNDSISIEINHVVNQNINIGKSNRKSSNSKKQGRNISIRKGKNNIKYFGSKTSKPNYHSQKSNRKYQKKLKKLIYLLKYKNNQLTY